MDEKACSRGKVRVLGRCITTNPDNVYNKFLKDAEERGLDHTRIDKGVRNKFVATWAEVEAGKKFYDWTLEDIGTRYKIIGGKTWRAGDDMLFPLELVNSRQINMHLWDEYPKVS